MNDGVIVSPINVSIFRVLINLQTSYLVQIYNNNRYIQRLKSKWPWQTLNVKGLVKVKDETGKKKQQQMIITPTDIIPDTNIQDNKRHFMKQAFFTLM